jgi:hypothetical protein
MIWLLERLASYLFWNVTLLHSGAAHQQRQQATSDFGQQGNLTNQAQGTLSQFEGPVQQSPFYKALLTTGIQNTSNAYDTATSNMRQRANAAGFGYNQPVEQGAENQVRQQETSALANVPQQATIAATQPALAAAGQTGAMGMGYGQQGTSLLNPNAAQTGSFYNQLLNLAQTGMQGGAQYAAAH